MSSTGNFDAIQPLCMYCGLVYSMDTSFLATHALEIAVLQPVDSLIQLELQFLLTKLLESPMCGIYGVNK